MNHERIFYGTTGFVVEKIDETTGEELLTYLDDEGFDATKGIDLPKNAFIHVNTQSMCYGQGIHGIKISSDTMVKFQIVHSQSTNSKQYGMY